MDSSSAQPATPDFSLPASTGQTLSLDSFRGKVPLAIVFLTGLDSDRELLASLNGGLAEFGAERSQLLAVVKDTATNVRQAAAAEGIVMPILADAGGAMFRDFGAEDHDGKARRMAVIVGIQGELVDQIDSLPVDDAVAVLLAGIRALEPAQSHRQQSPPET